MPFRLAELTDDDSRVLEPALNYLSHRVSRNLAPRSTTKRRKTDGLNDRFDRMIETVNVIHTADTSSRSESRRRRATSGSSSITSHEEPRTPVDMYNSLEGGRLGENFYILKMKPPSGRGHRPLQETFESPRVPSQEPPEDTPPTWLANTVAGLAPSHPLRELIPIPGTHIPSYSSASDRLGHLSPARNDARPVDEEIFAFQPPSGPSSPPDSQAVSPDAELGQGHTQLLDAAAGITSAPLQTTFKQPQLVQSYPTDRPISSRSTSPFAPLETSNVYHPQLPVDDPAYVPFSTPGPYSIDNQSPRQMHKDLALASPFSFGRPFSTPGPFVAMTSPLLPTDRNPNAFCSNQSRSSTTRYMEDTATHDHYAIPHSPHSGLRSFIRTTSPVVHQQKFEANTVVSSPKPESSPPPLHARYKVYFDSPMEDPFGSDPLEPPQYELDLDYSTLDFHWTKFDRSHESDDQTTQQAIVEGTMPKALLMGDTVYLNRPTSPQIDPLLTDQTLHVEDEDTESDTSGDASDPSTIGKNLPNHSPTLKNDDINKSLEQGTTGFKMESDILKKTRNLSDVADIQSTQPDAQVEKIASLAPTFPKEPADLTGRNASELHMSESPPKTPVNQIGPALPRTPPLRRKAIICHRGPSVPQIAVLKQESEDEEVQSEPKLSQASHDTIESWSAL